MLKWTDHATTWASFFCDHPLLPTTQEKNDYFLNNFIGDPGSPKRQQVADSLGQNQGLITQYRLLTKYLLDQAPNAAFNIPGYSWHRRPLLVAGTIETVDGRIKGPRLALIYANKGEGLGFYFCAHGLGEGNIPQVADIDNACCDQLNLFRLLGGRIVQTDIDIPNNSGTLQPIMRRLDNETAAHPHNTKFLAKYFPNGLVSPLYPKIIPRQNDK